MVLSVWNNDRQVYEYWWSWEPPPPPATAGQRVVAIEDALPVLPPNARRLPGEGVRPIGTIVTAPASDGGGLFLLGLGAALAWAFWGSK
jgi:hypothetical protein